MRQSAPEKRGFPASGRDVSSNVRLLRHVYFYSEVIVIWDMLLKEGSRDLISIQSACKRYRLYLGHLKLADDSWLFSIQDTIQV